MNTPPSIINHFRPLYLSIRENAYKLDGSATLVKGDNCYFIITCAHCLEKADNKPLLIHCGARLWRVDEFEEVFNSGGDRNDKVDILAYLIPPSYISQFGESCQFIHLNDICSASIADEPYSVFVGGFPGTWNKPFLPSGILEGRQIPRSQGFKAEVFTKEHRAFNRDEYDRVMHTAFHYPKRFKDNKGLRSMSPDTEGMSGGPVFVATGDKEEVTYLLEGIIFERHAQGYLVSTSLEKVFNILHETDKKANKAQ